MSVEKIDKEIIKEFLATLDPERTKIYLGCDSERFMFKGKPHADYQLVVVVHKNGNQGCKIFGRIVREQVYDPKHKPKMRLLTEVHKVVDLYHELKEVLNDYETEIHLDLNPNDDFVSSLVVKEALGYVKGMCNMDAKIKSVAYAASYAADQLKRISNIQYEDFDSAVPA